MPSSCFVCPRIAHAICLALVAAAPCILAAQAPIAVPAYETYRDAARSPAERTSDLLSRMTLEEKATMLSGSGWMESAPIERLGIPAIKMADGPMGVRSWAGSSAVTNAKGSPQTLATSFPSGEVMASTWDTALVEREGRAIGQQVKALGRDMILGPTVNINRVPLWGRNFEGYGEDPYLAGQLGVAYIKGVQAEGVIPSVKHFAANNEEFERHRIDESISDRALHEIYLPAFKAAVQQGHVWTVMSCYNLVNGKHCAESVPLLTDVLKKEFGFQGFVISDWGSTYSTADTVNAGMDLEMPGGDAMKRWMAIGQAQAAGNGAGWLAADKVLAAVKTGAITEATIDDNVSRILRVLFESGLFDHPHPGPLEPGGGEVDTPEQKAVALQGATEGIVLLKNVLLKGTGALLPLDPTRIHSIAVIGPNAATARTGGGGSSLVKPKYAVAPLDGIKERAGSGLTVNYALGVSMAGEDQKLDEPAPRAGLLAEAVKAAAESDVAIVVVGRNAKIESESYDLKTMDLPQGQDELIAAVEKANPRTIVVLNTGDPVTMTGWLDTTPALVDMGYGGQEAGHALAAILFGDANPSGKLPVSLPKRFEDSPAYGHYPGENLHVDYAEGIYVGYRYFDTGNVNTRNVTPAFPFGFGLSYTSFSLSDLKVMPMTVAGGPDQPPFVEVVCKIRNTGPRPGAEVAQLYIHDAHSKIDRPAHELKAFARVDLKPGEEKLVHFRLDRSAFSYWSSEQHQWIAAPGAFEIQVGSSSRDIKLRRIMILKEAALP